MNIRAAYRHITHKMGDTLFHPQYFSHSFLKRYMQRKAPDLTGRVADLGCGQMPYRVYLRHTEYFSLDYPTTVVLDKYVKEPDIYGDLASIPFVTECMDGVICIQVLEHVPDPTTVMSEISRILRPGGILLLSVPFIYPLHDEPYDFFRFTEHGLTRLVQQCGMEILELDAQGGFFSLAGELFNLYCLQKIDNLLKAGGIKKWLCFIFAACFLPLAVVNNIFCILLSPLDRDRRFAMNYFIYARKNK